MSIGLLAWFYSNYCVKSFSDKLGMSPPACLLGLIWAFPTKKGTSTLWEAPPHGNVTPAKKLKLFALGVELVSSFGSSGRVGS